MRINKFIAKSGISSRRKAEELVKNGQVYINGKVVEDLSYRVKDNDEVVVNGKILELKDKFYLKLNKPIGYISSNFDPYNKKDLNDLIDIDERFFCAGRLDKDSHGLMLITNDGAITNKLIHPSKVIDKIYIVKVNKKLSETELLSFKNPIKLSSKEITSKSDIEYLSDNTYKVVIHQGFNRQIRRMFAYFGVKVLDLKRIKIGKIKLGNLKSGDYAKLSNEEINYLRCL